MDAPERAAAVHGSGAVVARVTRAAGETHAAVLDIVGRALTPLGPAARIPVALTGTAATGNYATVAAAAKLAAALGAPVAAASADPDVEPASTRPAAVAWLAALSAAFGDQMAGAPTVAALTVPMGLRSAGQLVDPADPGIPVGSGTLMVLVHGLGSHESMWSPDYARAAEAAGAVPLTVRYTTGQAITDSGAELADLLERVVATWPVPVTRLVLVGHSMGGLVIREALARERSWRALVDDVITLGTPHAGAPLERGARVALGVVGANPVAAPIAALGDERSAGIKDLAFGDVADADPRVAWHLVAGTLVGRPPMTWLGDGMVGVDSALAVPADRTARRVRIDGADHVALLDHPKVATLIEEVLRGR